MKALTWNDGMMQRRRQEYAEASPERRQEMRGIWQETVERLEGLAAGRRRRGEYLKIADEEETTAKTWRQMLDWASQQNGQSVMFGTESEGSA